jgi:pimeloyl-ACP methyl ester carboxylesterase
MNNANIFLFAVWKNQHTILLMIARRADVLMKLNQKGVEADCSIFLPAKPKRDSGLLIGVLHGWLGSGTLHALAAELSHTGHTVFAVDHGSMTNKRRSQAVHQATKAAARETGIRDVMYIGHSLAARDIVAAALHQKHKENVTYKVQRVVTVDGVGTNGQKINPLAVIGDVKGHLSLIREVPEDYAAVAGMSVFNFFSNPFMHSYEGISALTYDATHDVEVLRGAGVAVEHHFHANDGVIKAPQDGRGTIHEGSHLTFAVQPDTAQYIVRAA